MRIDGIEIRETVINEKWTINLPWYRAQRPEWPFWEKERLAAMHQFINPGDVVYDIGAEEGDLPALYATWGARLVLVEPNPKVWPTTRITWKANDLPEPVGWWVGLCSDVTELDPPLLDFDATERDGWPECSYDEPIPGHGFRHIWEHATSTPQLTLTDLVEQVGTPPDVITMDVEGGEGHVLRGAVETLKEFRPIVFASLHVDFMRDLYREHPREIHALMADLGYAERFLATDHEEHWMWLP